MNAYSVPCFYPMVSCQPFVSAPQKWFSCENKTPVPSPTQLAQRLKVLLETTKFADIRVGSLKLHSPVVLARWPCFQQRAFSGTEAEVINLCVDFIYTNEFSVQCSNQQLCSVLEFSKRVGFKTLEQYCQKELMRKLSKENVFAILKACVEADLLSEVDWVCWWIGVNKPQITAEFITSMSTHPGVLAKAINQISNLTLARPPLLSPFAKKESFGDSIDALFTTGKHSDFTLKYGEMTFKLHACMFYDWPFFEVLKHSNPSTHEPKSEMPMGAFRKMLRSFYGTVEELSWAEAGWILAMKEYYMLDTSLPLIKSCIEVLGSEIHSENWIEAYRLGLAINDSGLADRAKIVSQTIYIDPEQVVQLIEEFHQQNTVLKQENLQLKKNLKSER